MCGVAVDGFEAILRSVEGYFQQWWLTRHANSSEWSAGFYCLAIIQKAAESNISLPCTIRSVEAGLDWPWMDLTEEASMS
jgi:hypothetical protein